MYQFPNKFFTITNITILFILFFYFFMQQFPLSNLLFGLNINFYDGLYFQLITTMFIHGGIAHLLFNTITLFQFGNAIEYYFGIAKFIFLYYIGGVLTSLLSFYFMVYVYDGSLNLIGASGAICVLIGFLAIKDKYNRKGFIIWILAISLIPLLLGLNIAWFSHLIGLLIGLIMGLFL